VCVVIVAKLRFCGELDLPPVPTPAGLTADESADVSQRVGESQTAYARYLEADGKTYGVRSAVSVDAMSRAFAYQRDGEPRVLRPGDSIDVLGLRLRLTLQDLAESRAQQMALEIENTTDNALAYRVQTHPSKGTMPCHRKQDIPHNAIVVLPRGREIRSECLYRDGWTLEIQSVETIELPELSAIYVSWMSPGELGIDGRSSRGHRPLGERKPCDVHHPAGVFRGIERGEIAWRDLIDFYARHRCLTFRYQTGYKAFEKSGERPLPAASVSN
jgi:hypothetical protein